MRNMVNCIMGQREQWFMEKQILVNS